MDFKSRIIYRIECASQPDITGYIKEHTPAFITLGVSTDGEMCYQFLVVPWGNINLIHRENDMERVKRIQKYIGELKGIDDDE
jgi:hypothetical protein